MACVWFSRVHQQVTRPMDSYIKYSSPCMTRGQRSVNARRALAMNRVEEFRRRSDTRRQAALRATRQRSRFETATARSM